MATNHTHNTLPLVFRMWLVEYLLDRAGYEVIADSAFKLRISKKAA